MNNGKNDQWKVLGIIVLAVVVYLIITGPVKRIVRGDLDVEPTSVPIMQANSGPYLEVSDVEKTMVPFQMVEGLFLKGKGLPIVVHNPSPQEAWIIAQGLEIIGKNDENLCIATPILNPPANGDLLSGEGEPTEEVMLTLMPGCEITVEFTVLYDLMFR